MAFLNVFRFAVVVPAMVAAGCASLQPPQAPEAAVTARAAQRWEALLKGNTDGAYQFLSPGTREITSLEAYRSAVRTGFWKQARVASAKCAADTCEVSVEVEYEYRGGRVKTPLGETWIRQEGNWWYVLK